MTRDFDVAVVGASCAGLTVARDLRASGISTVVLDARPDFSAPTRTWIVTQKLGALLGEDVRTSVVHETSVMDMVAGASRCRVALDPPDWIVERGELRRSLARSAAGDGAEILLRHRVNAIAPERGAIRIDYGRNGRRGALRVGHVVGADGVQSVVARAVGAARQKTVPVVQARVRLPEGWDPTVTRVWFERQQTRFFFWLIPESQETGVVGLIADGPEDARGVLDRFLARQGLRPLEYQGAMIPLHQRGRRISWCFGRNRVLLVGDAASHVKVTTVGGVVSGIWGARAAARAIRDDSSYAGELTALRRELHLHDTVRWFMDHFESHHYSALFDLLNPELTSLLSRHDRDSLSPRVARLILAQPRVLGLALRVVGRRSTLLRLPDLMRLFVNVSRSEPRVWNDPERAMGLAD